MLPPETILGLLLFSLSIRGGTAQSNTPPSISTVTNQTVAANSEFTLQFMVSDAETSADGLIIRANSSDTNLVGTASILLGGTASNRTLSVRPVKNGYG